MESIDSNTVVRFPRNIAIKGKEQKKTLCEKGLQTEVNSTPRNTPQKMSPVSKNKSKAINQTISSKKVNTLNERKDIKLQKNNQVINTESKKSGSSDKVKWRHSDEKANIVLNDIISVSITQLFHYI